MPKRESCGSIRLASRPPSRSPPTYDPHSTRCTAGCHTSRDFDAVRCAHRAQQARAAHLRDAPARRGTDRARGAGRGIRRHARARAPDRGERLREGAERSEAPLCGDGDPGASAGALASNPLPWWEKLTMDVSLWVRFTATQRCERGAAHRVLIEPSFDDLCMALCIIDRALSRALQ